MANRIVGNVLIIDTTAVNLQFPGDSVSSKIQAIAFCSADSTGLLELVTQANTTNTVVKMQSPLNQPNTINQRYPGGHYFEKLYVKSVTVGTAFIYFQ